MGWMNNTKSLYDCMNQLIVSDRRGGLVNVENGFEIWADMIGDIRREGRTVYLIGNGASASMASHFSADLAKNAHIHTEVFFDLSLITAISNDISFSEVFAEPIRRRMKKRTWLLLLAAPGNPQIS